MIVLSELLEIVTAETILQTVRASMHPTACPNVDKVSYRVTPSITLSLSTVKRI